MGFGDKLKDLRKQAQETVAEHRDQIHDAVGAVGVAANAKTRGKHTQRIAKFGEKAGSALDKFADKGDGATESEETGTANPGTADAETAAPAPEGAAAPEPTTSAGEPEAPISPPSSVPPPSSAPPPSAPPAPNPDLAAWAAGEDSAEQQ